MNPQRQFDRRRHRIPILLAVLFAVAALVAALERVDTGMAPARMTGTFTGEITPDGPVYRMPPIYVLADRKAELARMVREERDTGVSQASTHAVATNALGRDALQ